MAKAKAKKPNKKKNRWLMLVISFAACLLLSIVGGYFALLYAGSQMIEASKLTDLSKEASVVYDKDGNAIYTLFVKETRDYIPYNKIPKNLVNAFVAVEDKRFFEHNGVDIVRIAGAIIKDIKSGSAKEGGSTITQQLARNVFLSDEKTFWRKTKEVSIAINLDRNYSKEQIMEMYLNKIYLGGGVYGVEAASKYYFDKSLDQGQTLTLAQAAALAGTVKAPSYYSPFSEPAKAKERRDTILRLMYEQGMITEAEKEAAQNEPMPVPKDSGNEKGGNQKAYRAYIDYVLKEAADKYGVEEGMLYKGGWKIYTAMDKQMQDSMVAAFANPKNFPKDGAKRPVEAAMIVLDPKTGGIAGMMGGRNYVPKGYNLAVDATRQPGSSFKPLVAYAPALDTDDSLNIYSRLSNQYQEFNGYKPRNYNGKYSESISMIDALKQSLNVPPVWLLNDIGIGTGLEYVQKFGIELHPEDRNLAIALGGLTTGVSPLKMAQAYSTFDNGGVMSEAHAIVRIEEPTIGFKETVQLKQTPVLKPKTAWEMHTMLRAAVESGVGKGARMSRPVAGKTGTTQSGISDSSKDNKDIWFVGYTPEYVSAVWMGFDKEDKQHMLHNSSDIPAKLFKTVFTDGLKGKPVVEFTRPDGVSEEVQKEEPQAKPLSLAADMTMDEKKELKVVLSWAGGEEKGTYSLYRFINSPDDKELIQEGLTTTSYMDSLTDAIPYHYLVVQKNEQGEEVGSDEAMLDISHLQKLLEDGATHHDDQPQTGEGSSGEGVNPDGEQPTDGNTGNEVPMDGVQGDPNDPNNAGQEPVTPVDGGVSNNGQDNGQGGDNNGNGDPNNNGSSDGAQQPPAQENGND